MPQTFAKPPTVAFAGTDYSHLEKATALCPISTVILPPHAPAFNTGQAFSKSSRFSLVRTVDYTDFEQALLETPKGGILQVSGLSHRISQRVIDHFDAIYNFHPGCLQTNRGARPEIHSILRRDSHLTLTIHRIDSEKFDCGPTLQVFTLPIEYRLGWSNLYLQLCQLRELAAVWLFGHFAQGVKPEESPTECGPGSYLAKPSDELIERFYSFEGSLEEFLKSQPPPRCV